MTTDTLTSKATPSPSYPLLFRLALKVLLSELRKHPHTLLWQALEYLQEGKPLPRSAPVLFRFALEVVAGQVEKHPGTLLAALVKELRALVDSNTLLALSPRVLQRLDDMERHASQMTA